MQKEVILQLFSTCPHFFLSLVSRALHKSGVPVYLKNENVTIVAKKMSLSLQRQCHNRSAKMSPLLQRERHHLCSENVTIIATKNVTIVASEMSQTLQQKMSQMLQRKCHKRCIGRQTFKSILTSKMIFPGQSIVVRPHSAVRQIFLSGCHKILTASF
jgi:hypothetical protein